jgi:MFS family permease
MVQNPAPSDTFLKNIFKELVQPFIDLFHAPRALWGVNLGYMLEGLAYFGILTYLAIYFSDFVFKGVEHADVWSHNMVMVLTAGIAISMVLLGFIPDKMGVRNSLIFAFVLLLSGRIVMSASSLIFGFASAGVWSPLHLMTMGGILLIVIGYGAYQPAAYSAVRQFTTPKTASMAYAMLYALMNAGSALTMAGFMIRDEKFLGLGINGAFWIYTFITFLALLVTIFILSKKTVNKTIADARVQTDEINKQEKAALIKDEKNPAAPAASAEAKKVPFTVWIVLFGILATVIARIGGPWKFIGAVCVLFVPLTIMVLPVRQRTPVINWIATHPLANTRFFFFIFALIPVQTLFTYNWLILPQYLSRAYTGGWIGEYYEIASNANPILIFFLVPIITALTCKRDVYNMMITGTLVMSSSAFILAFGPTPLALGGYIIVVTVGEAMWSARFLQYATEIAPEGKAGLYQGVAQLPWFLTKFLVPLLYSGRMMEHYCPANGPQNTGTMWLIFGLIAIISPISLWLAKGWMMKDFKTGH